MSLQRPLLKDLLGRLIAAQRALAKDATLGPIVAVASAGAMPDGADAQEECWGQ